VNKNTKDSTKTYHLQRLSSTKRPCQSRKSYLREKWWNKRKKNKEETDNKVKKKETKTWPKLTIYENPALQNVLATVPKKEKWISNKKEKNRQK